MLMARIFIGTMISFGSVVVLLVTLLMARDVARLSSLNATTKSQQVTYVSHAR